MQHNSRLLNLPAEMREEIYRLALIESDPVDVTDKRGLGEPALLAVCKQIRSETLWIYYAKNQFQIRMLESPCRPVQQPQTIGFLKGLGDERRQLVQSLSLKLRAHSGVGRPLKAQERERHLLQVADPKCLAVYAKTAQWHLNWLVENGVNLSTVEFSAPKSVNTSEDRRHAFYAAAGQQLLVC